MSTGSPYRSAVTPPVVVEVAPAPIARGAADLWPLWLVLFALVACLELYGASRLRPSSRSVEPAEQAWQRARIAFAGSAIVSRPPADFFFHVHVECDCWREPSCCDPPDRAMGVDGGPWDDAAPLLAISHCYPNDRFDRLGTSYLPAYGPRSARRHRASASVSVGTRVDVLRIVATNAEAEEILESLPTRKLEACHTRALFDHPGKTLRVEVSRTPSPDRGYADELQIWPRQVRDPRVRCCLEMAAMELMPSEPSSPVRVELRLVPTREPRRR